MQQFAAHTRTNLPTWVLLGIFFFLGSYSQLIAQSNKPVARGLVTRYAFTQSTADSSTLKNNLTGNLLYGPDKNNQAAAAAIFNGVTLNTASFALPIGRDFALSCWINPAILPPRNKLHSIVSIELVATLYFNLGLSGVGSDSGIGFQMRSGGATQPFVNHVPPNDYTNVWTHVGVSRANTKLTLFINGNAVDSATVNEGLVDGLSNLMLIGGSPLLKGFGFGGYYTGLLDDLRLYNRALSTLEIDSLAGKIATSINRHHTENRAQVWATERFYEAHPQAVLYSITGAVLPPAHSAPGMYIWQDGARRRRLILQ